MGKKILIISHNCVSKVNNNGKTIESIFSYFPKDDLYQVFFMNQKYMDLNFCNSYFRISDFDLLKAVFSLNLKKCGKIIDSSDSVNLCSDKTNNNTMFYCCMKKLFNSFRDYLWLLPFWKSNNLISWIDKINPDIVFYVGANKSFSHRITRYIVNKFNLKLFTFFTDDYIIYHQSSSLLDFCNQHILRTQYNKTISLSSNLFTIGELMSEEYSSYFNRKFSTIMNNVEINPSHQISSTTTKSEYIISYFGGLHLGRWKMISDLAQSILSISNVHIHVYTTSSITKEIKDAFSRNRVIFNDAVFGEELKARMNEADLLLHVESEKYKSLTKLSVSTKIPEYLVSGKLILAYGPLDLASIKLIFDNNLGAVISSSCTKDEISYKIKHIITDRNNWSEVINSSFQYAKTNYDKHKNSKNLFNIINNN